MPRATIVTDEPQSRNVYIASLPIDFTKERLYALFTPYGRILSAKLKYDVATGLCQGYGFVLFAKAREALCAVEGVNGREVGIGKVQVRLARPEATTRRALGQARNSTPSTAAATPPSDAPLPFAPPLPAAFDSIGTSLFWTLPQMWPYLLVTSPIQDMWADTMLTSDGWPAVWATAGAA